MYLLLFIRDQLSIKMLDGYELQLFLWSTLLILIVAWVAMALFKKHCTRYCSLN